MPSLSYLVLLFLHGLYSVAYFAYSCWKRLVYAPPLSLTAPRRQLPKHLAILFIPDSGTHYDLTEKCLLESVYRVIDWSKEVGINTLTLYDEHGLLRSLAPAIERHLLAVVPSQLDDTDYPPTPPLSDCTPRSLSPDCAAPQLPFTTINASFDADTHHMLGKPSATRSTTIYVVSADASKPAIAAVASTMAKEEAAYHKLEADSPLFSLTIDEMKWRLEGKNGLPPADFMIVHPLSPSKYNRTALELHSFPLFQTRLTEIHHNRLLARHDAWINWVLPSRFYSRRLPVPLTEVAFREALDDFAGAEMRFGK
ncbi:hypothetical protein CYLTODRAFT_424871 [Cylindrobasidium torrendii FP15055 ss-10]|uniref:ditrans,polycis-polyprenyl diphosphate synthase [(2E,6E)-farnesyldiphosphate specific] n=1 Tax=Cylindrobasidium torrendii FP15055 ss-10 TaxID=1314674 RepID=A0A0D7B3R4_9AGAR|nr:hypothetical protein CYLTODRAFT_424871 [Cylindrobasidium torrendii FP15055 ss-10]